MIDASDIVVRINKGVNILNEDNAKYLGQRADLLYHCLLEDPPGSNGAQMGFITPSHWADKGIKHIFCLPGSSFEGVATGNSFHNLVSMRSVQQIEKCLPMSMIDSEIYNNASSLVQCKPTTGFLSIFHLLNMLGNAHGKIKVFGFSFMLDGWFDEYRAGIENLPENQNKRTYEQIMEKHFTSKRHKQKNHWLCCKNLFLKDKRFEPDLMLTKILNMDDFSKKEFSKLVLKC